MRGPPTRRLLALMSSLPIIALQSRGAEQRRASRADTASNADPVPRLFAEFHALLDLPAAATVTRDGIEAALVDRIGWPRVALPDSSDTLVYRQEVNNVAAIRQAQQTEAAAERERVAQIEVERQAGIRAQAEREAANAEAQRQREDAQRAADRQAREKAEAESAAWAQREAEVALASDPCNQPGMRRQLMDAANGMGRAHYGGRLLDLMRGRSMRVEGAPGVSCMFLGQWSSGEQGLATITVRKNSLAGDLIEVRP